MNDRLKRESSSNSGALSRAQAICLTMDPSSSIGYDELVKHPLLDKQEQCVCQKSLKMSLSSLQRTFTVGGKVFRSGDLDWILSLRRRFCKADDANILTWLIYTVSLWCVRSDLWGQPLCVCVCVNIWFQLIVGNSSFMEYVYKS